MATFLSILILIVCLLLILVVLIQNPKGGGIASNFMSSNQIIGARQQVELIEQITWGCVAALVVLCIAFAAIVGNGTGQTQTQESIVGKSEMPVPGGNTMPTMPAQNQNAAPAQQAPAQQAPASQPAPNQ